MLDAATGVSIPQVNILLLAGDSSTGTTAVLTLVLTDVLISGLEPRPARRPGDPALVDLDLNAAVIELQTNAGISSFDRRSATGNGCSLGSTLALVNAANAPNQGVGLGTPITSWGFSVSKASSFGSGATRESESTQISEPGFSAGLVPIGACLFGAVFSSTTGLEVRIDNYDAPTDVDPALTVEFKDALFTQFELTTGSGGAATIESAFGFRLIELTSDGASTVFDTTMR